MPKSKPTHGGKRKGAGRKPTIGATVRSTISLTPDDYAFLLKHGGGKVSQGVRKAIDYMRTVGNYQ